MSASELQDWRDYYDENPFDDVHRYHRPAALVANSMSGIEFSKAVEILVNGKPKEDELTDIDKSILNAFH